MVQAVEESVRREPLSSLQSSPDATPAPPPKTQVERKKVVIPIQDKDGVKQFHIYMAIESESQELELDLSSLSAVNKVFAAIFSKLEVPTKTTMSATILEETTKWHGHCSSTFIGAAYNNKDSHGTKSKVNESKCKKVLQKESKNSYRINAWKLPKLDSNEAMRAAKLAKLDSFM